MARDDDRSALRAAFRGRRRALPAAERIAAAERLATQLRGLACMPRAGCVAGYWSMDGEIALHAWQVGLADGIEYCLPVLHEDGRLRFARWRPGAPLEANRFGIPEPRVDAAQLLSADAMALVVMPLVAFDAGGQRLGMGAGWYDRTFAFRRGHARPPWLVGAAFAVQQAGALPARDWDVPMDALCTERDTLLFPTQATTA